MDTKQAQERPMPEPRVIANIRYSIGLPQAGEYEFVSMEKQGYRLIIEAWDALTAALAAERLIGDDLATAIIDAQECPVCGGHGTHYTGIAGPDGDDVDVSPDACDFQDVVDDALARWRAARKEGT